MGGGEGGEGGWGERVPLGRNHIHTYIYIYIYMYIQCLQFLPPFPPRVRELRDLYISACLVLQLTCADLAKLRQKETALL